MPTESVFDIKPSGLTDMKRESPAITLFTFTALKKICLFRPKVQIRDMCRREVTRAFIHAESMHGKACVRVLLRKSCKKNMFLTLAGAASLLISWVTQTLPNRHKPLPFCATVHSRRLFLFGVIDAWTFDFHQWLGVHGHSIRERGKIPHSVWALLEVNPYWHQSYTGAHVLECEVETFLGHGTHLAYLSIELENAISKVSLSKTLISSNGINLGELMLLEVAALVIICL